MKKILILGLLAILSGGAGPATRGAVPAARAAAVPDKDSEIRVYNISDLLWARKDYPFESGITMPPTMPPTRVAINANRGRGGGGGGYGGGSSGLFGGGA